MLDTSKYITLFKIEAEEYLKELNSGLLRIEEEPDNKELLEEILRSAHTLKGSAKMIDLNDIGEIAHYMEDILRKVSDKKLVLTSNIVDVLFEGTESIKILLDGISMDNPPEVDVKGIVKRLIEATNADDMEKKEEKGKIDTLLSSKTPTDKKLPEIIEKEEIKSETAILSESKSTTPTESTIPAKEEEISKPKLEKTLSTEETKEIHKAHKVSETIRVEVNKLDKLLNLVNELMINKFKLIDQAEFFKALLDKIDVITMQKNTSFEKDFLEELNNNINNFSDDFSDTIISLELISNELQDQTREIRMLPISTILDEFKHLVRNLARELGKEIKFNIIGEETEIDKRMLEEIKPSLLHIIRNAIDHGIELPEEREQRGKPRQGLLEIKVFRSGSNITIEIYDDGKGLDTEQIKQKAIERGIIYPNEALSMDDNDLRYLIFHSGFSTSEIITDISGRGVGMDVVKTNIEKIKGSVTLESEVNKYTRLSLELPLTLSSLWALLVRSANNVFALPLSFVEETSKIYIEDITSEGMEQVINVKGMPVPLVFLEDLLEIGNRYKIEKGKMPIVIITSRGKKLALAVDTCIKEQEVVIKSLGNFLKSVKNVSGCTILGNGNPAMILNVYDLFESARTKSRRHKFEKEKEDIIRKKILVVDDSLITRTMEQNILIAANYNVETAEDGQTAWEMAQHNKYDLIVTDIEMPNMDGFELTEKLKQTERYSDIPIIIVTSRASNEDKSRGIEVGAQGYIVKGTFEQGNLLRVVKALI